MSATKHGANKQLSDSQNSGTQDAVKFDDRLFANTPFRDNLRKLKKAGLAQQGTDGRDAMARAKEQRKRKKTGDPAFAAECDVFLQAMEGLTVRTSAGDKGTDKDDEAFFQATLGAELGGHTAGEKKSQAARSFARAGQAAVRAGAGKMQAKPAGKTAARAASNAAARAVSSSAGTPAAQSAAARSAAAQPDMSMQELLAADDMPMDDFAKAMAGVTPISKSGREVALEKPEKPLVWQQGNALQDFLDGKLEFALTFTDEYMEGFVVGLDPIMMQKLRQGSFSPEAHIDLHGLNTQPAFETLRGFFKGSWYRGLRCVIVVCGRGKNSPDGIGILREKLQLWLTQEPFKRVVLAFCTAQVHDGGAGAVYVLMRKFKKKGRIAWERMPADEDLL